MGVLATRSAHVCADRFSQAIRALRVWLLRLPPPPAVPAGVPTTAHPAHAAHPPIPEYAPSALARQAAHEVMATGYGCFIVPTIYGPATVVQDHGPDFKTALPA